MEMSRNLSSKASASAAAAGVAPAADLLRIKAVTIEPNNCPLGAPLALTIPFVLSAPVKGAYWSLHYEADISSKRHKIPLSTTAPPRDLEAGENLFNHAIEAIPTEGVKEKYLLQVGMLKLELFSTQSPAEALVSINMVTMVSKDDHGVLRRNVISPLEE